MIRKGKTRTVGCCVSESVNTLYCMNTNTPVCFFTPLSSARRGKLHVFVWLATQQHLTMESPRLEGDSGAELVRHVWTDATLFRAQGITGTWATCTLSSCLSFAVSIGLQLTGCIVCGIRSGGTRPAGLISQQLAAILILLSMCYKGHNPGIMYHHNGDAWSVKAALQWRTWGSLTF